MRKHTTTKPLMGLKHTQSQRDARMAFQLTQRQLPAASVKSLLLGLWEARERGEQALGRERLHIARELTDNSFAPIVEDAS